LGHRDYAALLDLLIDILLLKLGENSFVKILDDHGELWIKVSLGILKVIDEHTDDSKRITYNS